MSQQNPESYIPYESVAVAQVEDDENLASFVTSVFPEATELQVEKLRQYVIGKTHDGIQVGLELSHRRPMSQVEIYNLGLTEGYERATEDRTIMEEPEEGEE